jgi:NMD protein affecting ribosome stability and mRNA decay
MTRLIRCCQCGTEVVASSADSPRKLSLCSSCWRPMPSHEIVRRSREHDAGTTECPQHAPITCVSG